jgi:hypothetical protein
MNDLPQIISCAHGFFHAELIANCKSTIPDCSEEIRDPHSASMDPHSLLQIGGRGVSSWYFLALSRHPERQYSKDQTTDSDNAFECGST